MGKVVWKGSSCVSPNYVMQVYEAQTCGCPLEDTSCTVDSNNKQAWAVVYTLATLAEVLPLLDIKKISAALT